MLFTKQEFDFTVPAGASYLTRRLEDYNLMSGQGQERLIYLPNEEMRLVQSRLLKWLRYRYLFPYWVVGCQPGISNFSTLHNLSRYRYFYLADLSRAYSQVRCNTLAEMLTNLGGGTRMVWQEFLQRVCFEFDGGLMTGAICSPDLFNLYLAEGPDKEIIRISKALGVTYTRVLDDLIFASDEPLVSGIRRQLRQPLMATGLLINHRKCRVADINKQPIVICGIGIARGGRLFIPRVYLDKVRAVLHQIPKNPGLFSTVCGLMSPIIRLKKMGFTTRRTRRLMREFISLNRALY